MILFKSVIKKVTEITFKNTNKHNSVFIILSLNDEHTQ